MKKKPKNMKKGAQRSLKKQRLYLYHKLKQFDQSEFLYDLSFNLLYLHNCFSFVHVLFYPF